MAAAYAHRGVKVNCVMIPVVRIEERQLHKFSSWFRFIGPLFQYHNPFARPIQLTAEGLHAVRRADVVVDGEEVRIRLAGPARERS